jgi:hypothetical protein
MIVSIGDDASGAWLKSELTRLVAMGLLDTTGGGSRLASSLGSKLLARG